jgi:hypothetical protein
MDPVPGVLSLDALESLYSESRGREYCLILTREEQEHAIRKLAAGGLSDYDLVAATGLAVEIIRQVIGERS